MKTILYWKVGDTYYKDYEEAMNIIALCNRDKEDYGIEND